MDQWCFSTGEGIRLTPSTEFPEEITGIVNESDIPSTPLNYAKTMMHMDGLSSIRFEMDGYYTDIATEEILGFTIEKKEDGWAFRLNEELFNPTQMTTKSLYTSPATTDLPASTESKYDIGDLHPEIVTLVGIFRGIGDLLLHIQPDDFSSKWGSRLYMLINSFYDRYSSLPTVDEVRSVVAASIGGLEDSDRKELTEVTTLVTTVAGWDIRDEVIRDIAAKFLREVRVNQALLQVAEDRDDLPKAIELLTTAAKFELSAQSMAQFTDLDRLNNAGDIIQKIPMGWDSFDEMTQGGVLRPSLMMVVGKPYAGKTQVLMNMADNFMQRGYHVLYFSMELSEKLLMMRADAARLGMHYQEIYVDDNIEDTKAKLKDITRTMTGELTVIKYPPGTSLSKIRVHCDIFATVYGSFDVMMIDYVGLVEPSRYRDNMHQDGKAVAEELVTIGEQHEATVVAAAQTTRGAASVDINQLSEEHIGGSWGFQQVAYDTIMLSRASDSLMTNKLDVKWVKNRSGGKLGITSLYSVPNTFKLTDDVNELFSLSEKVGISLLPEEITALMESVRGGQDG